MSGPFGSSQWMYASGGFYNGVATQSLRFDDGSSAYLTRTPSSAGNRRIWTWSGWIKRSNLGSEQTIFSAGTISSSRDQIRFESNDKIGVYFNNGTNGSFNTTQVFRDSSSWYHILLNFDSAQATASNRRKLYINGVQVTSFSSNSDVTLNTDSLINNTNAHNIGRDIGSGSAYVDSYLAEINFVDGSALDPTSFGEFKNGVWIAKRYTGSYGTNGFRLQFNQTGTGTASSSTIGADTSGNANHFTSSGIVASDCDIPDSPENNFATICPLSSGAGVFSEGNLKYVSTSDTGNGTFGISSGKAYLEVYVSSASNNYIGILDIRNLSPTRGGGWGSHGAIAYKQNGDQYSAPVGGSSATASYGASYTTGDIIGIAFDVEADTVTFYKNGSSQGNTTNGLSHISSNGVYSFLVYGDNSTYIINTGQDGTFAGNATAQGNTDENGYGDFYYSPPSGYLALCTANLPEPTISPNADTQADDYFNTVLYTGNGSTQSITGVGFQPDLLWIKGRSFIAAHVLQDTVRGANKAIYPNLTNAEDTNWVGHSFDTDGFTVDNTYSSETNNNSNSFVAWNWKAGGTAVSNTDGDITTSVSANTDAGFSIISYTGNGSASLQTIGHGLSAKPELAIAKVRTLGYNWMVLFDIIDGSYDFIQGLNTTSAKSDGSGTFATTSTLTLLSGGNLNGTSEDYICYCFHSVEGYSKFGSYTGNGSTDGTFVYTGFRPAWVLIKNTNTSDDNWYLADDTRDTDGNPMTQILNPNTSVAEYTTGSNKIDFTSNGIKMRDSASGDTNISGEVYIYMAFARTPFKYSLGK